MLAVIFYKILTDIMKTLIVPYSMYRILYQTSQKL